MTALTMKHNHGPAMTFKTLETLTNVQSVHNDSTRKRAKSHLRQSHPPHPFPHPFRHRC